MATDECKYCEGTGFLKTDTDNLKCICKYADNAVSKDIKILIDRIYAIGIFNGKINILCDSVKGAIKDVVKERLNE